MCSDPRQPDATPIIDGITIAEHEGRDDEPEGQIDPETFADEHDPRRIEREYPDDYAVDWPAVPR
jgi:hypothetical protein